METSYSAIDFFILLLYQHRSFITNEMEFYLIFLERNISSSIFFFYDFVFGYQLIIIFYLCFFFVNNSLRFMWENLFFLCANKIKIKIFENIFNRYIFSLLSTFFLLLATFSGIHHINASVSNWYVSKMCFCSHELNFDILSYVSLQIHQQLSAIIRKRSAIMRKTCNMQSN